MMRTTFEPENRNMHPPYNHRQSGFIGPLLAALAVGMLTWSMFMPDEASWVLASIAALHSVLAVCFWHLETDVRDRQLKVSFGPLRLFRTTRQLDGATAETARSDWLDGWGIHRIPGRSTIWNISGFDCVEITFVDGKPLRIGTNDVDGLTAAINAVAEEAL
jgi:hypothetical protein